MKPFSGCARVGPRRNGEVMEKASKTAPLRRRENGKNHGGQLELNREKERRDPLILDQKTHTLPCEGETKKGRRPALSENPGRVQKKRKKKGGHNPRIGLWGVTKKNGGKTGSWGEVLRVADGRDFLQKSGGVVIYAGSKSGKGKNKGGREAFKGSRSRNMPMVKLVGSA